MYPRADRKMLHRHPARGELPRVRRLVSAAGRPGKENAMPSTYAHYRFGQDVLEALPGKYREVLLREEDLFNIGLHGPDILFYYKPFTHHRIHGEGGRMHRLTGRQYFSEAGKIFLERGPRTADYAYLCGFLCHFALDRACHGYINDLAARGEVSHAEIESEFDRILLVEDGIDPIRRNLAAHIHTSRRAAKVISAYFPGASQKVILEGIFSLWGSNLLLTLPGHLGYRWVDRVLQRLPAYSLIHGHMIDLDPNPLCERSNSVLRGKYEDAVSDAAHLIREFLPALRGQKEWSSLMDYDFESTPASSN